MATKKEEGIKLTAYAEPHSEEFKKITSDITKGTFEEKNFYPEVDAADYHASEKAKKSAKGVKPKATEPLSDTKESELTGTKSEAVYIELPNGKDEAIKASFLEFADGSKYKVGKGFISLGKKAFESEEK